MTVRPTELTGTEEFIVVTEQGEELPAEASFHNVYADTLEQGKRRIIGKTVLVCLQDGRRLKPLEKPGEYKIVATGQKVTRRAD